MMANRYNFNPPFTREQLQSDYNSGLTQSELATRYSTSQKVVFNAMRKWGIEARVAAKRYQRGSQNGSWKGSNAGYAALHKRIESLFGKPQRCEVCGTCDASKTYDWASLSGHYDDPADYTRMCRSCHWKHDDKHKNLGSYAQRKAVDSNA